MIYNTCDLVMSLVYLLYGIECVVQGAPCLKFWLYHLMTKMWCPLARRLIFYHKAFMLNPLSPWYILMLIPISVYILASMWSSCMILFYLFELQSFCCEEVDHGLFFIQERHYIDIKSLFIIQCLYDVVICLMADEFFSLLQLGSFCI